MFANKQMSAIFTITRNYTQTYKNYLDMHNEIQNISQREVFTQKLKSLKPDVTESDRKKAFEAGISYTKISRYLKGHVADLDVAAKLIAIFTEGIKDRYNTSKTNIELPVQ